MFGIAFAFFFLNRWRSDSGASYAWVGRSMNPSLGLNRWNATHGRNVQLSPDALNLLEIYPWPSFQKRVSWID